MTTQRQVCRVPAGSLCWYLSRGPLTACLCLHLVLVRHDQMAHAAQTSHPDKPGKPALASQFACLPGLEARSSSYHAQGAIAHQGHFRATRGTRCARRQCMRHEVSLIICHFLSPVLAVFFLGAFERH